jgi:excinuclease ABC subunit A
LKLGGGVVLISIIDGEELLFSEHFACVQCGISLGEIAPRTFSFNSPHGACPNCTGLGIKLEIDPDLVLPDKNLSLEQGAIHPYQWQNWYMYSVREMARCNGFDMDTPIKDLTSRQIKLILYGEADYKFKYTDKRGNEREYSEKFEGVIPRMERLHHDTESETSRSYIERYMVSRPCPVCEGKRLKPEALAVTIGNKNIDDITSMSVIQVLDWVKMLSGKDTLFNQREKKIAREILKEIGARWAFWRMLVWITFL